jgi:porin
MTIVRLMGLIAIAAGVMLFNGLCQAQTTMPRYPLDQQDAGNISSVNPAPITYENWQDQATQNGQHPSGGCNACNPGPCSCKSGAENGAAKPAPDPSPQIGGQLPWEAGMLSNLPFRKRMAERGVTFFGVDQTMGFGNVVGGINPDFDAVNRFTLQTHLDLEKMFNRKGSELLASIAQNDGHNIGDDVGTPYNPSTLFQPAAFRLWQFYLGQYFFDRQVHVKFGRIDANNNDFAYTPFEFGYASAAYDSASTAMFQNYKGFGGEPVAQWGVRLAIQPKGRNSYLRIGAYNAEPALFAGDDALSRSSAHGVDFSFRPDLGALYIAEYGYRRNQAPGDTGMPGKFKIGFVYDTSSFDRFDVPNQTQRDLYGMYLQARQMVTREGSGCEGDDKNDEGLTLWTSFGIHPDQRIAAFPYYVSWGAKRQGLIEGRDKDVIWFGNYYSANSRFNGGGLETQFEASYIAHVKPSWQIGPTMQYFVRPGGTGSIDNALLIGFQSLLLF